MSQLGSESTTPDGATSVRKRARWKYISDYTGLAALSSAGLFTCMESVNLVLDWLFPTPSHAAFVEHRLGWRLFYAAALFLAGMATLRLAVRKKNDVIQQKKRLRYLHWKDQQSTQAPVPGAH